ncbi:unnamed protein product [Sphagnum tenellum]
MIMTRRMKEFTLPQNGQLPRTASLKKHRSMITAAQSPCNVDAGGCVSTLFHMFDWNPSGKKMNSSATKRLPSQRLEDEHYVRRERSLKEQSSSSESSSCKSREEDDNCSKRVVVPGVVARLMGLEFLPESTTAAENSSSQGLDHLKLRQQQLPSPPPMTPVLLQELLRQEAGFKDSKKSLLKEKYPRGVPFSTRKQQQQPSSHEYLLQRQEAGEEEEEEEEIAPPWRKRKPRHMRSIIGAATEDAHFVDTRRIRKPAPPRRKPEQQQQPKRPFLSRLQAPPAALLPSKAQNQQLLSSPIRSPASSSLAGPSKRMLFEAAAKILEPNMQPSSRRHLTASPSQTSQHQGASFGHQLARRRGGSHGLPLHSSKVSRTESMARSWNAQEDAPGEGRRMLRSQQQQPSCRPPRRRRPQPASNVSIGAAEPQTNSSKLHVEVVGIAAATKAALKTSFGRKQSGSGNNQYSRSSKSETTAVASRSQSHQERIMDQMQQAVGSNEMLQAPDQALAASTEILQLADHNEIITTENCSNPNPSVAKLELTSQETAAAAAARKEELHEVEVEVASCWQSTLGVQEEEKEDADFNVNIHDDDDDGWRRRSAQMVVEPNIGNERRKSDEPPSGGHGFRKMAMWAGRFRVQQQPGKQESKEIGLQGNRVFPLEKAVQGGSSQADLQQQQGGGGGGGPHMTLVLAKSIARSLLRYSRLFGLPKVINNKKESEEAHKKGGDEDGLVLLNHRLTRNVLNMRPILKHQSAGYGDDDDEEEAPPQPPGQKAASSHTTLVLTPLQEGGIQQCDDDGALNLTTDGGGGGREEQAAVQQQQKQPEATNLGGGALDTMKSIDSLNVRGNLSPCNESLQTSPSSSSSSSCNRRRLEGREVGSPRMMTRSIDEVFPELPLEVMINMDVRTQNDQPDSAQITTDVTTMTTAEEEEEEEQLLRFESSQRKHQQSFNDCQLRGEHVYRRRRSSLSGSPNGRDVWVVSEGIRSPDVFVTEHHHLGMFPCSPLIDYETVFFPEEKTPSNFQHVFAMMASSSSNSPFFNQELNGGCCTPQENQPNLEYCAQQKQQLGTLFHEGDSPVVFAMRLNSAECQLVGLSSGMDDCGQPSPVSVLESRFLDESPMTTPEASLAESEQQVEKRDVRTYGVDWGVQKQKLDKRHQQPHAPAVVQSETQSALERIERENIKQAILTICRSSRVDVSRLRLEEFQTTVQQESPQDEKDYVRTVLEASEFWELKDASSSWNTVVPQTQTSLPAAALDRCLAGKWIDFSQEIVQVALGIEQMLLKIMIEELVDDVCTISRF